MTQAALGAHLTFETLDGDEDLVDARRHPDRAGCSGCAAGACPTSTAAAAATCSCRSCVDTPTDLDASEEELLRQLAELRGEDVAPADDGLLLADPLRVQVARRVVAGGRRRPHVFVDDLERADARRRRPPPPRPGAPPARRRRV